ncbi:DUF4238 domain-containing protein [Methylobacterium sp. J-001]|uniref:DUF4238 domain-containing protein n=1 Tax=Methylobacterium sp. J-001 TaxID=2836609 RepID=UPI001FB9F912|nr:DUF4238 domain-containing protein [Methylobacterium sp. J-001]MCJ2120084.1 DUF4238 domain-containing protein [Methylobacterium sp. J-001]
MTASKPRQTKAKKHHYIPRSFQERFSGPDLNLWFYDKRERAFGVRRKPIARLFRGWELYTVVGLDGARDRTTETRLSVIEGRASPILDRVITEAREGRASLFSEAERLALSTFFIAQFRRSPDLHNTVAGRRRVDDAVAEVIAEWEAAGHIAPSSQRSAVENERLGRKIRGNLLAENAAAPMETASPVMMQRGFTTGVIRLPQRSFVLGSTQFARLLSPQRRQDLGDPGSELWLPIASDVALCSHGLPGRGRLLEIDRDQDVRKVNGAIVSASTVFASPNRELVEALSRRMGEYQPPEGEIAVPPSAFNQERT